MTLFELKTAIKNKTTPKFLVFYGTEYVILETYIKQIAKINNLTIRSINNCAAVLQNKGIVSLTGDNYLYICRYDLDFIKAEKLWQNIDKRLGTNYLILILNSIDGRSKFSKIFADRILEFNEQDEPTVMNMLKSSCELSDENCKRLIRGCNYNYSKCLLELDKVKAYSNINKKSQNDSYKDLCKSEVILEDSEVKIQDFIDSLMNRDKSCIKKYIKLIKSGESNVVILMWLYNAVKNQLAVQTVSKPSQDILGINYYFIKECLSRMNYYTEKELIRFLGIVKDCEQGFKSGLIEESIIIEYIIAMVL